MYKANNLSKEEIQNDGYEIPEFVKIASEGEPTMFAYFDGLTHRFPIDTPSNAWLSQVQFVKEASTFSEKDRKTIEQNLADASEFHHLEFNRHLEKKASLDDEMIKLASEIVSFENKVHNLAPAQRRAIAKELKHRAEVLEESGSRKMNSDTVERYAGDDIAPDWRNHILDRLNVSANHPIAKRDYTHLLNSAKEIEAHEHPEELAKLLEFLDHKHELEGHWDHSIHDPFFSMLANNPHKKAVIIVLHAKDRNFTPEDLEKFDRGALSKSLAPDIIDEIFNKKNESLDHLEPFVKNLIASLLNA